MEGQLGSLRMMDIHGSLGVEALGSQHVGMEQLPSGKQLFLCVDRQTWVLLAGKVAFCATVDWAELIWQK